MAKLKKLTLSNQKRIDITGYFDKSLIEDDDNSGIWITIKKLPYSIKKKIDFLSTNTFSAKLQKQILNKFKEKGITAEEYDGMNDTEKGLMFIDIDLEDKDSKDITDFAINIAELIFNNGIDPKKHNIENENGELIELDYNICNDLLSETCIEFLIKEIKAISKGFSLEK